jgi:hypothetical protein
MKRRLLQLLRRRMLSIVRPMNIWAGLKWRVRPEDSMSCSAMGAVWSMLNERLLE